MLDRDLDSVKVGYGQLSAEAAERLGRLEQALPLARQFQGTHEKLLSWLATVPLDGGHVGGQEMTGHEADLELEVCSMLFYDFVQVG